MLTAVFFGLIAGVALAYWLWADITPVEIVKRIIPEEPPPDPLKSAYALVEQERNQPVGRKARVEVPTPLKHYSDRRRFLAVQLAEWRNQSYKPPADYADLALLIQQRHLVEMVPVSDVHVLYGAGESATDSPFSHFLAGSRESVPLFASDEEFQMVAAPIEEKLRASQLTIAALEVEWKTSRNRAAKRAIQRKLVEARSEFEKAEREHKLLRTFRSESIRREIIRSDYEQLTRIAIELGGGPADLNDSVARENLKRRLLHFIRPEARDVLLEIAGAYYGRFGRPLPVTSLVRTEQYQHLLSRTNPNAAHVAAAPHTTGLAFDIYDHFMDAEEQTFLMGFIADLETAGRVEALKETRDHIHVFVFSNGKPPKEQYIADSLETVGASRATAKRKRRAERKTATHRNVKRAAGQAGS